MFRWVAGYLVGLLIFGVLFPALLIAAGKLYPVPLFFFPAMGQLIALMLFVPGLVFVFWSNLDLVKYGKGGPADFSGWSISPRTIHLVVKGSYRYTRNPMVFGISGIYLAICTWMNSAIAAGIWILFLILVALYIKWVEEPRLIRDFGDSYRQYRCRVPMLFPFAYFYPKL
ncbi:MAG: isoprenylcysteine carboxylmethyltransferase family protein [Bacteroidetes bacterium]|nr:isoprenylcysteine carboxylmethyltransferase family protein [Bacteroidota bacterium]